MSFKDIRGQDRQIEIIKRAIENGRVPHAYLFLGEEGVGKRLTALTLAKALNCSTERADSCDVCQVCKKITNGNHPDVTLLEPEGNLIKIDQIRELQRSLQYKPYEGRRKVCIIPNAEKMNLPAANSMLKTLEEPPPDTILILTSASPHLLLSTINSRCQRLKFQPLAPTLIAKVVEEKLGKEKEFSLTIASLARGSSNRACELAEGATLEYRNRLINQISALSPNSVDDTFKLAEEMAKEKDGLIGTLEVLKTWFRDLVIVKENCPANRLINIDLEEEIERLEKKFSVMDLLEKIRIIDDAESALLRNSNKRLTLEVMLARLSQ